MTKVTELRLLHVHAHPDDESSKGAGTTAYYVDQGVQVMVATCTGGEAGDILNESMNTEENRANLSRIRQTEMAQAARILGIHQRWLGYKDSGYPEDESYVPAPDTFAAQHIDEEVGRLVQIIREFRPQVMTCYTPDGGYPHPDHIRAHEVAIAALPQAADLNLWSEHGEPWQISKVYYDRTFNIARLVALDAVMRKWGLPSHLDGRLDRKQPEGPDYVITTSIPCADFFHVRNEALLAHRSQISPNDAWWFGVPLEVEREAWPTEDYHLAFSTVDTVIPEDDLFAGLRHLPSEG